MKDSKKVIAYMDSVLDDIKIEYKENFKTLATQLKCEVGLELPNTRIAGRPIRPFFVYTMHDYIQQESGNKLSIFSHQKKLSEKEIQQIGLIFEIVICIQYYHNQILDYKYEITTEDKVKKNLQKAIALKKTLFKYINKTFNGRKKRLVLKYINRTLLYVDIGQWMQLNFNTYGKLVASSKGENCIPKNFEQVINNFINESIENVPTDADFQYLTAKAIHPNRAKLLERNILEWMHFNKYSKNRVQQLNIGKAVNDWTNLEPISIVLNGLKEEFSKEADFIEGYFKRTQMTCAVLYVSAVELLADLVGMKKDSKQKVLNFTRAYGAMRQLVNDNSDCIPSDQNPGTSTKLPSDAYSDFKTDNVTLNLILLWNKKKSNLQKFRGCIRGRKRITLEEEKIIYSDLIERQILYSTMSLGKQLKEEAIWYLNQNYINKPNENSVSRELIFTYLLGLAENNRYYKFLYDEKPKNYKAYKRNKTKPLYIFATKAQIATSVARDFKYSFTLHAGEELLLKNIEAPLFRKLHNYIEKTEEILIQKLSSILMKVRNFARILAK